MKAEALVLGGCVEFAGDLRRGGGVVDEDGAFAHALEGAVRAQGDLAQVVVVADAGEDDLLALGGLARSRGSASAVLGHPFLGLGRGAVVDRHLVALRREMPRHGIAHHAKSEKCNLRHNLLPELPFGSSASRGKVDPVFQPMRLFGLRGAMLGSSRKARRFMQSRWPAQGRPRRGSA